ncbi:MAG: hypothetical protein HUU20_05940 [Pirellulales bacterium]|nr:hypothetical protein [Pirellulales bacterium]
MATAEATRTSPIRKVVAFMGFSRMQTNPQAPAPIRDVQVLPDRGGPCQPIPWCCRFFHKLLYSSYCGKGDPLRKNFTLEATRPLGQWNRAPLGFGIANPAGCRWNVPGRRVCMTWALIAGVVWASETAFLGSHRSGCAAEVIGAATKSVAEVGSSSNAPSPVAEPVTRLTTPDGGRAAVADTPQTADALTAGVRRVVLAVREAAAENHARPDGLRGDRLTECLVRRSAAAASQLPRASAPKAFLLGLAAGTDDSSVLRTAPFIHQVFVAAESEDERRQRVAVLGKPTMRGRRDLAQHFVVSAALTVLVGPETAETLGTMKELRDTQGGTNFSFADLAADLSGIAFATHVLKAKIALGSLADSFLVSEFVPEVEPLPENVTWQAFLTEYGSAQNERFLKRRDAIRQTVLALPGYRK